MIKLYGVKFIKQDKRLIKQRSEESYNDENLQDLQKWINEGKFQQSSYRLIDKGSEPCKVKVSKKSMAICAKTLLK